MVNAKSAGPSESQATDSTVQAESASNEDDLQIFVPKTHFKKTQPPPTGNDQPYDKKLYGTSHDGPNEISNDSLNWNVLQEAASVQEEQNKQTQINKEIARLRTSKAFANSRQKLAWLWDEKAWRFSVEDDIRSEAFKQQLTMEQAKSVRELNVYLGQSQKALTDFFKQIDMVFEIKPLIYWLEVDKCIYAANQLAETPSQQWLKKKRRITKSLTCSFLYQKFKDFLQEKQLPEHV